MDQPSNDMNMDHPLKLTEKSEDVDWWLFKVCLLVIVVMRVSFFLLSSFGIATEWIGLSGAAFLILIGGFEQKRAQRIFSRKNTAYFIICF